MPVKKVIYVLLLSTVLTFSCKKKSTPVPDEPYVTDVYVVGYKVINYDRFGVVWKDGQQVMLTADVNSSINAVAVANNDVYLAGRNAEGAAYWKNGKEYFVSSGLSELFAVAVSGDDTYLAGMSWLPNDQYSRAAYWKNGTETDLTDGSAPAAINSITIYGADIYTAGYYNQGQNANTQGQPVAACWKNNTLLPLDNARVAVPGGSTAKSIAVNGGDVYATGYIGLTAAMWKNGALQQLDHSNVSPNLSFGFCVALSGNDVYVSGSDANTAAYWKNGALTSLITGAPVQSGATSMYFQGNDRYMAGYIGLNGQPVYWKNDTTQNLQNNGEPYSVNGIAVSRHQ
jgi:hypothetical protein